MSHTPGPWKVSLHHYFNEDKALVSAMRRKIADVPTYDQEGLANIHLIGAAPDMLDALKAQETYRKHYPCPTYTPGYPCNEAFRLLSAASDKRQQAIAKAEGRDNESS